MKIVKDYDNAFSANLAKGLLESSGIHAYVYNDNIGYITGLSNKSLLSIRLGVDDADYENALEILNTSSIENEANLNSEAANSELEEDNS
ncbi:MAG: DUF2007 domain-containing protein [Bacteroidales bacterium]